MALMVPFVYGLFVLGTLSIVAEAEVEKTHEESEKKTMSKSLFHISYKHLIYIFFILHLLYYFVIDS